MVDNDPGSYRPRRAYPEEPAEPEAPRDRPRRRPAGRRSDHRRSIPTTHPSRFTGTRSQPTPGAGDGSRRGWRRRRDADPRRRDGDAPRASRPRSSAEPGPGPRAVRARAERRARDEDSTTILPRTATGSRLRRSEEDALDDDERIRRGQRSRLGLLIAAVAGIVVLGLAIGYTVLSLTRPSAAPGVAPGVPATGRALERHQRPPAEPDRTPYSPTTRCSPRLAAKIDNERTWKVQLTQKGHRPTRPAGVSWWGAGRGPAHSATEHASGLDQHGQESAGCVAAGRRLRQPGGGGPGVCRRGQDARWLRDGRDLHRVRGLGHRARRPVAGTGR